MRYIKTYEAKLPGTNIEAEEMSFQELLNKYPQDINITKMSISSLTKNSDIKIVLTDLNGMEIFKKLKRIHLTHNKLTDVSNIENLSELEEISFFKNNITKQPNLDKLTKLKSVSFQENELTYFSDLANNIQLEKLYLGQNKLIKLPNLSHLKKLETLYLDNNKLDDIPGLFQLFFFDNLKYLDCYDNNLPYENSETYIKWFKKKFPSEWSAIKAVKKYNL